MSLGLAAPRLSRLQPSDHPSPAPRGVAPSFLKLPATVVLLGGLALLGAMLPIVGPANTLVVFAILIVPLVLATPAEGLIVLALAFAFFSRTLVVLGAPPLLNFAHYGFALVALLNLFEAAAPRPTRGLEIGLLAFLGSVLLSALINQWHLWRPLLDWLTFAEPFIFLGLVMSFSHAAKGRLQKLVIALALVQVPFALLQFASHGIGDQVQGTLINQGAGHHIMGGVTLVAGLLLLMRSPRGALSPLRLVPAVVLISLALFSDAKQVYGAFGLGLLLLALLDPRRAAPAILAPALVGVALVFIGAQFYPELKWLTDEAIIDEYADDKTETTTQIVGELGWSHAPYGLGPGNGLSRIGLSTVPGYANVPSFLLGSTTSELARRELNRYDASLVSSASASFYSWLGLYTDAGLLGIAGYVSMGVWVWLRLGSSPANQRSLGRYLLATAVILGLVFSWLEEPVFMVYLGVIIGTCLHPKTAPQDQPEDATAGANTVEPQPARPEVLDPPPARPEPVLSRVEGVLEGRAAAIV